MRKETKQVVFRLSEDMRDLLEAYSRETNVSMSYMLRYMIAALLSQHYVEDSKTAQMLKQLKNEGTPFERELASQLYEAGIQTFLKFKGR